METATLFSFPGADCVYQPPASDDLRSRVRGLVRSLYDDSEIEERRSEQRFPFPYLVQLTPVGEDGVTPAGAPCIVVGKQLSDHGLGFYHPKPIAYRRMIATLDTGEKQLSVLIDLTWCRFTQHGWYESGGRFLSIVETPQEKPAA